MIINTEPPIDFDEAPRLNIYCSDDEFHIELHVGVQSFKLDYSNEDYEAVRWMAKQFAHALNRMVGDVRLYGTEPAKTDLISYSDMLPSTKQKHGMDGIGITKGKGNEDISQA